MTYEELVASAFLLFLVLWRWNIRNDYPRGRLEFTKWLSVALFGGVGALLGARLLQILGTRNIHDPGAALWGGVLGGYLFVYIGFIYSFRGSLLVSAGRRQKWVDASVPGLFLAHALGRMGCLVADCCFGVPDFPVIPLEITFALICGVILQWVWSRGVRLKRPMLSSYFYGYGLFRFWAEYFRGDPGRGEFWIFTTSQWASLLAIVISGIFLDFGWRTRDKTAV